MSEQPPLVSIIIPTYNMRQWIAEAIDSALVQTYPHCEIIVVDDGSTDGTGDFSREKYGAQIRYVYQENKGRGAARNHGLHLARGIYVNFLDADDILAPHKIALQVDFLENHPEYAAVYGRTLLFYDNEPDSIYEPAIVAQYTSGNLLKEMVAAGGLLWTCPTLIRREWIERIGGFDEQMRRCEDFDFFLRLARAGALFAYLPGEPVAFYRKFPGRPSGPGGEKIPTSAGPGNEIVHTSSVLYALNKLAGTLSSREYRDLGMARAVARAQCEYGRALLLHQQRREGAVALLRSLRASDVGTRFWAIVYLALGTWLPFPWVERSFDTFMKWQSSLRRRHS